jgi:hypothetical protein
MRMSEACESWRTACKRQCAKRRVSAVPQCLQRRGPKPDALRARGALPASLNLPHGCQGSNGSPLCTMHSMHSMHEMRAVHELIQSPSARVRLGMNA